MFSGVFEIKRTCEEHYSLFREGHIFSLLMPVFKATGTFHCFCAWEHTFMYLNSVSPQKTSTVVNLITKSACGDITDDLIIWWRLGFHNL